MKDLWNKISLIGLYGKSPEEVLFKYRETVLLNRLTAILILLLTAYLPVELIFNGVELIGFVGIEIVIVALVYFWHHKGWLEFSKIYFLISGVFFITTMIFLVPKGVGNEFFLLPASMAGVLFLKEKWKAFLFWSIVISLYYISDDFRQNNDAFIELPKDKMPIFANVFVFMIFMMAFFIILYFRNINEEYQEIIHSQKNELVFSSQIISEKNKEITDSINYAKRIQEAILPSVENITAHLPGTFILYQPKDIVAGDFYWFEQVGDQSFIAAADCTGHGVPGALVSVVCSNALNRSLHESKISDPGKILDNARALVLDTLSKNDKDVKDGMDVSLCRITPNEGRTAFDVCWAGANNSLLYFKDGELKELNPDKQPVGKTEFPKPFTSRNIELKPGDLLFLFTDGFSDQFGGPKGKKFKFNNLKKILSEYSKERPEIINQKLKSAFELWKGELEQIDDVCIIGIKV